MRSPTPRVVSSRGSRASDERLACVSISISTSLATITQQAAASVPAVANQGQQFLPAPGAQVSRVGDDLASPLAANLPHCLRSTS